MNPTQPPLSTRPATLSGLPEVAPTPAVARMPLALAGLMVGVGATLVAAAAAFGTTVLLADPALGAPWAAALAAAVGVAAGGLPLGWLALRLARDMGPRAGRSGDALPAGMARPLFMDLAGREFARARRYGTGAALLLVDVDRFVRVCETRGPAAGDAVLTELLRQTAPTLRTADVITRFGSAQMAVFLAHADATGALDVAERIRERTEQLEVAFRPAGEPAAQRLRVTVSAGVAHLRPAHLNLQALIDDAQEAVAAARQSGGNCVRAAPVDTGAPGAAGGRGERRARPKHGGSA